MPAQPVLSVGSRSFTAEDIELIRWTVHRFAALSRTELARTICENLSWTAPNGWLKVEACLALLQRLQASGTLPLPPPRAPAPRVPAERLGTAPPSPLLRAPLAALGPIRVEPVSDEDRPAWNAMLAAYHPLGFRRACGAHQRYWVRELTPAGPRILGGLLFAAAAKAVAVRDAWIGWSDQQRRRGLHRIVANSRYLLLPDNAVPHLASHARSGAGISAEALSICRASAALDRLGAGGDPGGRRCGPGGVGQDPRLARRPADSVGRGGRRGLGENGSAGRLAGPPPLVRPGLRIIAGERHQARRRRRSTHRPPYARRLRW